MPILVPGPTDKPAIYLSPTMTSLYLAVSEPENKFQTFNFQQLQNCAKILDLYVCHQNNIIDKRTNEECD